MTRPSWQDLPAGPQLRRIIAERLGWHMRKIPVGTGGVAYDFLVYNNDDHIAYQREILDGDLQDEQAATDRTWLEAMEDDNCPRWDGDPDEACDLAYGMEYTVWQEDGIKHAWVVSPAYTASAPTESLAIVRAWLAATEDDPAYFH